MSSKSLIPLLLICGVVILSGNCAAQSTMPPCTGLPFGKIVGTVFIPNNNTGCKSRLVDFYSNCNPDYVSPFNRFVTTTDLFREEVAATTDWSGCPARIFSGLENQCVEAARRFLIYSSSAWFSSIDYACHIFNMSNLTKMRLVPTNQSGGLAKKYRCALEQIDFLKFENNISSEAPRAGDLIIYSTQGPDAAPTGHVAAIVRVELEKSNNRSSNSTTSSGKVFLAEQNWNERWNFPHYSRELPLFQSRSSSSTQPVYSIVDPPYQILGWKRPRV